MLMELRVISEQQSHLKENASIKFEGDLLSIGRSADNHWVLPDENLHLSGKHCIVSRKNDHFVITDLSTNGVYIDAQELPLGRGRSSVLKHGTQVSIGDYKISVAIDQPGPKSSYAIPQPSKEPLLHRETKAGLEAVLSDSNALEPMASISSNVGHEKAKTASDHLSPELSNFSVATPKITESPSIDFHPDTTSKESSPPPQKVLPDDWFLPIDADTEEPALSMTTATEQAIEEATEKKRENTAKLSKPQSQQQVSVTDNDVLEKILRAADLDPSFIKDKSDLAEKIGSLLKAFSHGMIKALATRSLVKGEFRLHQTMIQPSDNNPFKFSPTGREALSIVLFADSQAYQSGERAVLDSYTDIQAHQLAMMSGVQESLFKLLTRVDPDSLEEKFQRKPRHFHGVPGLKKINYWEEYKDFHEELKASMSDDLQGFFIKEFGAAYEEQLEKINKER